MKKILNLIALVMMTIIISSCSDVYATSTVYTEPSVDVVIENGTPYYNNNGYVIYYFYNGWYCYPYYYNRTYKFYFNRSPLSYRAIHHYRPIPRGYYYHRPHYHRIKPHITHHNNFSRGRIHNGGRTFGTRGR